MTDERKESPPECMEANVGLPLLQEPILLFISCSPALEPVLEYPGNGGRLRGLNIFFIRHVYMATVQEQVTIQGNASRLNPSRRQPARRACARDVTTADQSVVWKRLPEEL